MPEVMAFDAELRRVGVAGVRELPAVGGVIFVLMAGARQIGWSALSQARSESALAGGFVAGQARDVACCGRVVLDITAEGRQLAAERLRQLLPERRQARGRLPGQR